MITVTPVYGAGFAWARLATLDQHWVILLPNYGAFLFKGTEAEAEEMRQHKAVWEMEIAHKRPASVTDHPRPSRCWNHRGFVRQYWYGSRGRKLKKPYSPRFYCECGECSNVVQ